MVRRGIGLGAWRAWCAAAVLSVLFVFGLTSIAHATLYGSGDYSSCSYNSCPQPPQQTITTTPTGLQVAINLQNGQKIPLSGYTIMITPLNGKGSSFKKADIYINGVLVHTALPESTGTAQWKWIPSQTGKVSIKIVITDTNGATTTKNFTVNVTAQAKAKSAQPATTNTPPKKTGIAAVIQTIGHGINKAIKALPKPVVHAFPYILFVLLLAQAVLLGIQTTRELRELRAMRALYERARTVDDAKKSFTELVSHYLRTPLTVILSGIDLLSMDKTLVSSNVIDLKSTAQRMRQKVESLIAQLQSAPESAATASVEPIKIWRRPGLFVPVILIAVIWLVFEYLVSNVSTFSVGETELIIQSAAFTSVAVALYAVLRYRQLHRHDKEELHRIMANEQAVGQARDALIASTISILSDELKRMDQLIAQLTMSATTKPIESGRQRFHELLAKFAIASRLRGAQSDRPYVAVPFSTIFSKAMASVQDKAAAKGMAVRPSSDVQLSVQEPELLMYVLASLLDNSIAYSPEKSSVEVSAGTTAEGVSITVADHGSGVAPEKQPLLFQPFSKAEGAEVFTHEGMGFSLYLDRMIMTYLGGAISLGSKPGRGTVVKLTLPNAPQIIAPTSAGQQAVAGNVVTPTT